MRQTFWLGILTGLFSIGCLLFFDRAVLGGRYTTQNFYVKKLKDEILVMTKNFETMEQGLRDQHQEIALLRNSEGDLYRCEKTLQSLKRAYAQVTKADISEWEYEQNSLFNMLHKRSFSSLVSDLGTKARTNGDRFTFDASYFFKPGKKVRLSNEGKEALRYIAKELAFFAARAQTSLQWFIRIDVHSFVGHSDNWVTSAKRGIAVKNYLVQHGAPESRLALGSFGANWPLFEKNDHRNTRLEFSISPY